VSFGRFIACIPGLEDCFRVNPGFRKTTSRGERGGNIPRARAISFIGYSYMGIVRVPFRHDLHAGRA
jgi:hypothetical protein